MSFAWKGFHSFGGGFSPSFGPSLTGGITPIGSWDASTSTLAQLAALVSHSRTSLATMFDSTGKLTYAPNNLALYASDQSNAAWTAFSPSGSATAGVVTFTGAGNDFRYQTVTVGQTGRYIVSVLLSSGTKTGTVVLRDGILGSTTVTLTSTPTRYYYYTNINAGTYTFGLSNRVVDGGDGIAGTVNVSGYTLSAVTYETTPRTADQVITTAAAYYGPRIDYDPNTLAVKGLLIEEARTNLALQSNDLMTGSWPVSGVSKSTDGTLGPDGKSLMVKALATASGGSHELYQSFSVTSGIAYASSIFVKKGNHRYVAISFEVTGGFNGYLAVFDLDNPSAPTQTFATGVGSLSTSGIVNCGGGIYRIYVSGTVAMSGTGYIMAHLVSGATIPTTTVEPTNFVAAGTEYAYFFGGQFEVGLFPTSYIPGAAAAVTRAADALAAALYSSNPSIIQLRNLSTGARSRKKLTTYSSISSEINEWIEAIRVYPVGTSSAYLDAHLTVDGPW